MKNLFTPILIFVLSFNGCLGNELNSSEKTSTQPQSTYIDKTQNKTLFKLYDFLKLQGVKNVALNGDEIKIGDKKLNVSVSTEFSGAKENKWIFAAGFITKLIDSSEEVFTVGSIGIDDSEESAIDTAIEEWLGIFGTALSKMLQESKEVSIENFKIYSGLMGIRGEKPTTDWLNGSDKMSKKIITALLPTIKNEGKKMNSINLIVVVNEQGEINGECGLNNRVNEEIIELLKNLNWEKSATGYIFKQFYLVKKVS